MSLVVFKLFIEVQCPLLSMKFDELAVRCTSVVEAINDIMMRALWFQARVKSGHAASFVQGDEMLERWFVIELRQRGHLFAMALQHQARCDLADVVFGWMIIPSVHRAQDDAQVVGPVAALHPEEGGFGGFIGGGSPIILFGVHSAADACALDLGVLVAGVILVGDFIDVI